MCHPLSRCRVARREKQGQGQLRLPLEPSCGALQGLSPMPRSAASSASGEVFEPLDVWISRASRHRLRSRADELSAQVTLGTPGIEGEAGRARHQTASSTPEEFVAYKCEMAKWADVIRKAGVRAD